MPYARAHNLLTAHWHVAGAEPETGQFGLRFDSVDPPTLTSVTAAAGFLSAMWSAATTFISPLYQLDFVRGARIAPDGHYVPGSVSVDYVFPTPVPGGGTGGPALTILQGAFACSLRTAVPRGPGHAGRFYMPPLNRAIDANFRWAIADVNSRLNTVASRLSDISGSAIGVLSVFSKGTPAVPTGPVTVVDHIRADTRPDVQRRRAKQVPIVLSADFVVNPAP